MNGDILPDADHVSRYCKKKAVDGNHVLPTAFDPRDGETYLSFNWLEYLRAPDVDTAIELVRVAFRRKEFCVAPKGKFIVLNVGGIRAEVRVLTGTTPRIEHLPEIYDESHTGIWGYDMEDHTIKTHIANLVRPNSIYPAIPEKGDE